LKHEVAGKTLAIPLDGLVQLGGGHLIQIGEVGIEENLLTSYEINAALDRDHWVGRRQSRNPLSFTHLLHHVGGSSSFSIGCNSEKRLVTRFLSTCAELKKSSA
jgi:hypothetical protein